MKKTMQGVGCVALGALAAGCGRFWEDPYVDVTQTPLNWVEIHYYKADDKGNPVKRVNVRLTGVGRVEVKRGTSRLVSDPFAKDSAADNWGDVREHAFNVDPAHVREIFQDLVNAGLFDKDKTGTATDHPPRGRFVAVRAAIDNKTDSEVENLYETDPELAERFYNVVLEFSRPVLGGSR